jgi:hypothetical protein
MEFFSSFWDVLGADLVRILNYAFDCGKLSTSQRRGLIIVLYKKDEHLETKNYRPISLLNVDYKIATRAISGRLLGVIGSIVGSDQTCGIPNRFSSEHVRLLQDVIDYSNHNNLGGALVSLDQEKALDRVDWPFMLRVLQKMNFGPSFCSWVKILYSDIFSRVLVNGYVSDAFKVTRGVRQGCPLSPLLYILVAETIASAIKKDINIDGFTLMNGQCIKICQYADDTSIFVMSDRALLALFALFERFEHASGAKLNVNKSHGLLFGSWKDRVDMPIHLNWSNIAITVLGCCLSDGKTDWDSLVEKFQDQLLLWKQHQLSFRGRALVANVLGLSLLWYQAQIFDVPKTVIFKVNKILFPFVWGKKREWMARTSVIQPMVDGGLGVVDISKKILSFRAVWLRRFLSNSPHPWSVFFNHYRVLAFSSCSCGGCISMRYHSSLFGECIVISCLKGNQNRGMWVIPRPSRALLPVEELTAKKAYTFLLNYHHVEHRSLAKFQDLGFTVQWKHVWASLTLWRFVRSVQDTAWLSFHGILPTTDRLARFGMNVNPFCFCGQHESLLHLFTACAFATEVLDWFVSQLRKFNNLAVLSDCEILFGFLPSSDVPVVFTALLGVLRHHIWLARNNHRFENIAPDSFETLKKAKSTFRFLVRMHQRHCPQERFVHKWLADGVIGSLTQQDWICFTRDFIT